MTYHRLLVLFLIVLSPLAAVAQLPAPRLDRIQPLGIRAGTEAELEITAPDLDQIQNLRFAAAGIKAEPAAGERAKPGRFKVSVAAEVPSGTYDVWTVGKTGISNPRLLTVSRGLEEGLEKEPNNLAAEAQELSMNSATSGLFDDNNVDQYRIAAAKGQRFTIDLQALRLDSKLDGTLELLSPSGGLLTIGADYFGRDSFLDFVAPAAGTYTLLVHDLTYRGGSSYRLVVSDLPYLENVFPRAVEPGKPVEVTLYGRNLGPGSAPSTWTIEELPLDEWKVTLNPAVADPNLPRMFQFFQHPGDFSSLPTAATCTLRGFQFRPELPRACQQAVTLLEAWMPPVLEAEPNDDRQQPQSIPLPALVNGRFDRPRDADWYTIEVPEDQKGAYVFQVYCARLGSPADAYLLVTDEQGRELGEHDDSGQRAGAFEGKHRDPLGQVNLEGKKKYRVLVQDRFLGGGARGQYVLSIRKLDVDFHVAAIHRAAANPRGTTIRRGGAAYLDLIVQYEGPARPPITVTAENLPAGLHAAPCVVRAETGATLVLWADRDAPEWTGPISLVASAEQAGQNLRRPVVPCTKVWEQGAERALGASSTRPMQALMLAVAETAPYSLKFEPAEITAALGSKFEVKVVAERHWPDFKGKITLNRLSAPPPFKFGPLEIPEGQTTATLSIEIDKAAPQGPHTLTFLADAQVPYLKDKPSVKVDDPALPLRVIVTP